MFAASARRREIALAALVCLAACGAEIGPPPPGAGNDAAANVGPIDAAQLPDARQPPDAAPPDAQPCVEGDRQTQGPQGICYFLIEGPTTWTEARQACQGAGADLARIDSSAENDLLFVLASGLVDVWVGGNDRGHEGTWVWLDDSQPIEPPLYSHWRDPEPNNGGTSGEDENCMIIEADNPNREWDDRNCLNRTYPFICER